MIGIFASLFVVLVLMKEADNIDDEDKWIEYFEQFIDN